MASGDTIVLAEGETKFLLDCGGKIVIKLIDFTGAAKFTLDFVENEASVFVV